jgi:hypothetical protein
MFRIFLMPLQFISISPLTSSLRDVAEGRSWRWNADRPTSTSQAANHPAKQVLELMEAISGRRVPPSVAAVAEIALQLGIHADRDAPTSVRYGRGVRIALRAGALSTEKAQRAGYAPGPVRPCCEKRLRICFIRAIYLNGLSAGIRS